MPCRAVSLRNNSRSVVDGTVTAVGPGDMCFAAAHAPHGFEDFTDDFAIWVIFYGAVK